MKRPANHVTDDLGKNQLRAALTPLGWTLNEIVSDYGVDFDVEIFRNGESTGVTFRIQLKSSQVSEYSAAGDFVSQPLEVENARYLIDEMQTPTVLMHADVANNRLFWSALQLDDLAAAKLSGRDEGTITFRLPTTNRLPETAEQLYTAIAHARSRLSALGIARTSPADFSAALRDLPDLEKVLADMKTRTDTVRNDYAFKLFWDNRLDEAEIQLRTVLDDPAAGVGTKVVTVLTLEKVELRRAIVNQSSDADRTKIALAAAERLMALAEGAPAPFRLYAIMTREVAKLAILIDQSFGLLLNLRIAREQGRDPLWLLELMFRWTEMNNRIAAKLKQCYRLANYGRSAKGLVLADPIVRLGSAMVLLAVQFRIEEETDAERSILQSAFELFQFAANLSWRVKDEQRVGEAIRAARLVSSDPNSDSYRWSMAELEKIKDPTTKAAVADVLDRLRRREHGEELPYTIKGTTKQLYENVAKGAGINMDDDADPRGRLVRIAIADADPTRVLLPCEHIFVTLIPIAWATRLGMSSGAAKILHCTKHRHAATGRDLDSAYLTFSKEFCSTCADAAPRDKSWIYSDEWQQAENDKHSDFANAFYADPERQRNAKRALP